MLSGAVLCLCGEEREKELARRVFRKLSLLRSVMTAQRGMRGASTAPRAICSRGNFALGASINRI